MHDQKDGPHEHKKDVPRYTLVVKNVIELLSTQQVIEDAKDVFFTGVGQLKGYQYKIEIDTSVSPVVTPLRRTPDKLQADSKICLDDMEKTGVIEKQPVQQIGSAACCVSPSQMGSYEPA